jgi:photosystem II stability/assembly factor-like uncharacterized protein
MLNNNDEVTPIRFFLSQNYPNPFSEKTVIKYCVAYKTKVQLTIYDAEGKLIEKLVDEEKNPGTYEVEFSTCHSRESLPEGKASGNLLEGYYFYRMTAGDYSSEKKWLCINKLSGRLNMKSFIQTLFFFLLVTQICFAQWYQQNSGTDKNLSAVQFIDANNGFVVGDSGIILRTTDAGNNWEIQPSETDLPLNDIFFLDENNGWIAGGYVNTGGGFWAYGIILRTTDGGTTWSKQLEDSLDRHSGIFFKDSLNGWCVAYRILKTTDGGVNWSEVIGLSWEVWNDVYFKNLDTGIIVGVRFGEGRGSAAYTIETTDGGLNWYGGDLPVGFPAGEGGLGGVCSSDSASVFAVGGIQTFPGNVSYGIIAKTTDWGTTWAIDNIPGPPFSDVYFTDETNGWIVGVNRILSTSDGGVTWTIQMSDTLNVFSSVYFADVSNGWTVGDNGAIFHTTNGGVSFVEEKVIDEIPAEFLLSQNYPNPFNPTTSIQYAISGRQFVSLKVYDILGSEIETLVNEEKPAGTYEVTWYAEQLPSGVYFYQLRAASFIETKKMLLLK